MMKKLILLSFVAIFAGACGSSTGNNSVTYAEPPANANVVSNVNANSLPAGVSASPVSPTAEQTPGIPDPASVNVSVSPTPGATPTPGIPDPATLNKPFKPGATPTPGIPSQEELRRQLQRAANGVPPSTKGDPAPRKDGKPSINRPE